MKAVKASFCVPLAVALLVFGSVVAWGQDNLEGPWGTMNGDNFGRARSDAIPAPYAPGGTLTEAWRVNVQAVGLNRIGGYGMPTFDAAGNIYFRTTLGNNKMASYAPDGTLRWIAKNGSNQDFVFGAGWNSTSPVVGQQRVYALGAGNYNSTGFPVVAAFNKSTGAVIWETLLNSESVVWVDNQQYQPVLYNGKLYILGPSDGISANVYQVDAASGAINWVSPIAVFFNGHGVPTFVPDAFGSGLHGLYFNLDTGSGSDGFGEMYGIRINPASGATLMWEADGGKTGHSHVIYSPVTGHLYTPTWHDYDDATMYAFDLTNGFLFSNAGNSPAGGHGFYDTASLGWDDMTVIAGGFDGRVGYYHDTGSAFDVVVYPFAQFYGEYRIRQQLLLSDQDETIFVSGTNSRCNDFGEAARLVVLNLDDATAGPFEDGPMYVDDIEVLQGPDLGNLSMLFTDDFEALNTGDLPGQNQWEDDRVSPSGDAGPVQVIADPTGMVGGQVIELDALGTSGGWHGAYRNFSDSTDNVVVIRWRQYRPDRTDNVWPYFGDAVNDFAFAWTIGWDSSLKYFPYHFDDPNGDGAVLQDKNVWETVEFVYDFANFTVQLTITPDGGSPKVGQPIDQFEFGIYGIGFQLEGTAISENVNPTDLEFNTGICADHGFTMRGPTTGPDGKIYYFDSPTTELVAVQLDSGDPCAGQLCGDANCDGSFDGADIDAFFLGLGNPSQWEQTYPNCDLLCVADINGDQSVDGADIDAFFTALGVGHCP